MLIKKISFSFLLKLFSALVAYPTAIILARALGSEYYGIYGFLLTVIGLSIYPIILGLDQLIVKNRNNITDSFKLNNCYPILSFSVLYVLVISLVICIVINTLCYRYANIFGVYTQAICLGIWILPIYSFRRILVGYFRALGDTKWAIIPETIIQPLLLLIFAIIFFYNKEFIVNELTFIKVLIFSYFCSLIPLLIKSKNHIKKTFNITPYYKGWLRAGLFMSLVATAEGISMFIDRFMIGIFLTSKDVAIYLVASRNTSFMLFLESAFLFVSMPIISSLYEKGKSIQRIIGLQTMGNFLFTLIMFVFFIIFGADILSLFGPDFSLSYIPLLILASCYLLGAIFGAGTHVLIMTGFERVASRILLATTLSNIILNCAFIYWFGIVGAAIATLISELLKRILASYAVYRYNAVNITIFSFKLSYIKELAYS